ncbi:MAG TPA: enoyl-CoA hydratase-related protein [Pyrinomonadaceae bacterium]|nr:enoyl-CoA hydratase-related protein [Pyrinomonadaceae bacterium]
MAMVRLNRPEKLNALSGALIRELTQLLNELRQDQLLRAVILTGTGERAFCVGTDINEIAGLNKDEARAVSRRGQELCNLISEFPVPVIAAVNGLAVGGGCELALACHLRVASTNASFSLPEVKLGIIPGYGGSQRLAREIGRGRAIEIMLTGRSVAAEEAQRIGLVNQIAQAELLLEDSKSLAQQIAQLAPLAIRACLTAVNRGLELPLAEGMALETKIFADLFSTADMREGTNAFLEKRTPVFTGT